MTIPTMSDITNLAAERYAVRLARFSTRASGKDAWTVQFDGKDTKWIITCERIGKRNPILQWRYTNGLHGNGTYGRNGLQDALRTIAVWTRDGKIAL